MDHVLDVAVAVVVEVVDGDSYCSLSYNGVKYRKIVVHLVFFGTSIFSLYGTPLDFGIICSDVRYRFPFHVLQYCNILHTDISAHMSLMLQSTDNTFLSI
jgi:hypothetical protein